MRSSAKKTSRGVAAIYSDAPWWAVWVAVTVLVLSMWHAALWEYVLIQQMMAPTMRSCSASDWWLSPCNPDAWFAFHAILWVSVCVIGSVLIATVVLRCVLRRSGSFWWELAAISAGYMALPSVQIFSKYSLMDIVPVMVLFTAAIYAMGLVIQTLRAVLLKLLPGNPPRLFVVSAGTGFVLTAFFVAAFYIEHVGGLWSAIAVGVLLVIGMTLISAKSDEGTAHHGLAERSEGEAVGDIT